ncbi:hypothetical protein E4U41_003180 [Claviceps citrina]|nr:hypothetical protein E4U41_003180 [Claviceps citrina]
MSTVQLSFSLRVSSGVKTVHLLGSWDNYVGQLPLSKDKSASKSGTWKGTFRFQSAALEAGQRYWYYYIIDGYHVAHNPSVNSIIEPTTGRELNILDVLSDKSDKSSHSSRHHTSSSSFKDSRDSGDSKERKSSSSSSSKSSSKSSGKSSSRTSSSSTSSKSSPRKSSRSQSPLAVDIPKGRPLSVSQIQAPKPVSPHATKYILESDYYDTEQIEQLTARFGSAGIDDEYVTTNFGLSPVSSSGSSLSYRSDNSSPNSSLSGYSTPGSDCSSCVCERYGITRKGQRIKLDCGGSRCGYGDDSSDCSSYASEGEEPMYCAPQPNRRHGIIVT